MVEKVALGVDGEWPLQVVVDGVATLDGAGVVPGVVPGVAQGVVPARDKRVAVPLETARRAPRG